MTHTQLASPSEPIERGLLREWQRMYNAMDSKHEDKHPSADDFASLRRRTHEALRAQPAQPDLIQCGWVDEFGNVFPKSAWNPGRSSWIDDHKTKWQKVYRLASLAQAADSKEQAS